MPKKVWNSLQRAPPMRLHSCHHRQSRPFGAAFLIGSTNKKGEMQMINNVESIYPVREERLE